MMWRFAYFDKRANEIYIQSIRMNVDWTRTGLSDGVSVIVNAAIKNCKIIDCSSEASLRHDIIDINLVVQLLTQQ